MRTRAIRSVIYFGAGLGLLVSLFAAAEFFDASLRAVCTISSFFSCAAVDSSGLTSTLGIPDYLWGIGGFVLIFVVAGVAEARRKAPVWEYLLLLMTTAGVGLSLYFTYVELARIGAFCVVCGTAYAMGAVSWVGSILLVRKRARKRAESREHAEDPAAAGA